MIEWTEQEEHAFADIMAVGRLERLPAIRLYRRLHGDRQRVLTYAREAAEVRERTAHARAKRFNGGTFKAESASLKRSVRGKGCEMARTANRLLLREQPLAQRLVSFSCLETSQLKEALQGCCKLIL